MYIVCISVTRLLEQEGLMETDDKSVVMARVSTEPRRMSCDEEWRRGRRGSTQKESGVRRKEEGGKEIARCQS